MSVTTYGFDTLTLQSNAKVRNQVDFGSETCQNRHGLRAAGISCRASESCRPDHTSLRHRVVSHKIQIGRGADFNLCLTYNTK